MPPFPPHPCPPPPPPPPSPPSPPSPFPSPLFPDSLALRAHLLSTLNELSRADDDDTRLRACAVALRALAQLDQLELRRQRLAQHQHTSALAERHLTLLERRETRAQERHQRHLDDLDAQDKAAAAQPAPAPPDPLRAPLSEDELSDLQKLMPHLLPDRIRLPQLAGMWRHHLEEARAWHAHWMDNDEDEGPIEDLHLSTDKPPLPQPREAGENRLEGSTQQATEGSTTPSPQSPVPIPPSPPLPKARAP